MVKKRFNVIKKCFMTKKLLKEADSYLMIKGTMNIGAPFRYFSFVTSSAYSVGVRPKCFLKTVEK